MERIIKEILYCHDCDCRVEDIAIPLHQGHRLSVTASFNNITLTRVVHSISIVVGKSKTRKAWDRKRDDIYIRDGHKCVLCFCTENLTLDHIRPKSRGGKKLDKENLQTMCNDCNSWKATKIIDFIHPEAVHYWKNTPYKVDIEIKRRGRKVEGIDVTNIIPKEILPIVHKPEYINKPFLPTPWLIDKFGESGMSENLKKHLVIHNNNL